MARITQRLGFSRYEADEYFKQGLDFYQKGQFDDAVEQLTRAIATLPGRAEYLATRGFVYLEDDVTDKARADFEAALKHYPFELLAHYGLGVLAYKDKQWAAALEHFTKAYHADQKRAETLYYLALTQHRLSNNPAALTIMEQAQTLFDEANDKRRPQAGKWVREFKKLIDREND